MIARFAILAACVVLAGCQTTGVGSVIGGECKVFERPEYAVRGARQYDQDWVDSQIEGGVGGCNWKRPKPRPASFDAKPGQKAVAPAPKRRGLIKRIKDRVTVWPKSAPPVVATPEPPAPVVVPVVVPAAPPPRDAVDELLNPSGR